MFMHRNRGRHAQAVSLGILTTAIIVSAAAAAESTEPFVFVAYSNRTGGEKLAPQASFVVRNLSALQAHQTEVSQTTATAQLASAAHE